VPERTKSAQAARTFTALLIIAAVLIIVATSIYVVNQKARDDERHLAQARAVSVLPAGIEAAWTTYVDGRLAEAIHGEGDAIRVEAIISPTTYVSPNTPYQVYCFPNPKIGAWVTFGGDDDAIMVPIFGTMVGKRRGQQPALGVVGSSVAAARLSESLCGRVTAHVHKVMLAQVPNN
jgi:hypothetical protein